MSMLTDWLDWALHHRHQHDEIRQVETNPHYEMLLACYHSEQMTAAQLWEHMDDDPEFSAFVKTRMRGVDPVGSLEDERVLAHH
jgi:hypothetical protein